MLHSELKASLGSIVRLCLKQIKREEGRKGRKRKIKEKKRQRKKGDVK